MRAAFATRLGLCETRSMMDWLNAASDIATIAGTLATWAAGFFKKLSFCHKAA